MFMRVQFPPEAHIAIFIPNTDFTLDLEIESKIKVTRKYCNGLFCKKCNEPLVIQQKYFCSRKCRGEFYRIK